VAPAGTGRGVLVQAWVKVEGNVGRVVRVLVMSSTLTRPAAGVKRVDRGTVSHTDRALRVFGAAVATYEAAAIATGRLPTISRLCRCARRTPAGRVLVAGICLWLAVHLWTDPPTA
jgi:hypothetical protein